MKPSRQTPKKSVQRTPACVPKARESAPTAPVVNKVANALAMKQFAELISLDVDPESARSLDLRARSITTLPTNLGVLLKSLRKLDLGGNNITDLAALSSLPLLSNLNLSNNSNLKSLSSLHCPKLVVLSIASCGLRSVKGIECCAQTLRTLIANDNLLQLQTPEEQRRIPLLPAEVRAVPTESEAVGNYLALCSLTSCETVVLTRNLALCALYADGNDDADETPQTKNEENDEDAKAERQHITKLLAAAHPLSVFEKMSQLKKLSLSDCNLTCLPARWFLPMVTELRLAKNDLRSLRPEGVIIRSLKTLDVSHNKLSSIATLRRCHYVQKLNVRGNPFFDLYIARDREEAENVGAKKMSPSLADDKAGEMKSHAIPVSLQRSLKLMLTQLDAIDGQPLLAESELAFRRRPRSQMERNESDTSDEAENVQTETEPTLKARRTKEKKSTASREGGDVDSPVGKEKPRKATPKCDETTVAKVRAEAEEADVVVEAPAAVMKEASTSIVRRERTTPGRKQGVALSGEAAVAQILKQREAQGW